MRFTPVFCFFFHNAVPQKRPKMSEGNKEGKLTVSWKTCRVSVCGQQGAVITHNRAGYSRSGCKR